MTDDLGAEALVAAVGERPVRTYPALLSTEADALAWARADAPDGAVVVADYQAAPRGRSGLLWQVVPGRDLAFSVVLRPQLALEREGWLYSVVTLALCDVCGDDARIRWPDEVRRGDVRVGAVGVHVEPGPRAVEWAVASVLLADVGPPRSPLLARVLAAIDRRSASPPAETLAEHRARCTTIGRRVRAALLPMGPNAQRLTGTAASTLKDGALVVATEEGTRVAVPPQSLWLLEDDQ
ncbi:MAG: biotin--[acetyl-CoA-carboxylase] ligase [Actinomycetes bacterium]